jgi:hypothetical protein
MDQSEARRNAGRSVFVEVLEDLGFSEDRAAAAVSSMPFRHLLSKNILLRRKVELLILDPVRKRLQEIDRAGPLNMTQLLERGNLLRLLPDAEAAPYVAGQNAAEAAACEQFGSQVLRYMKEHDINLDAGDEFHFQYTVG